VPSNSLSTGMTSGNPYIIRSRLISPAMEMSKVFVKMPCSPWFPKTSVDERAGVLALTYECRRVLAKAALWLGDEYGYRPIRKSTYFHFNARVTKRRHMADDSLAVVPPELCEVVHYQQVPGVCAYRGGISAQRLRSLSIAGWCLRRLTIYFRSDAFGAIP
jgi:hypothetical protein